VLQTAVTLSERSPAIIGMLIRAYAQCGTPQRSTAASGGTKNDGNRRGYIPAAAFLHAYLGLGDNEQAMFWLDQACTEHSHIVAFIKVHPFFDPLRGDPRFPDLVRRVGFTP